MKKLVTLASVGVFLLSLQGASLAQGKAPAPRPPRPLRPLRQFRRLRQRPRPPRRKRRRPLK